VRFKESIKVTIEHGHANNYENDYSSVAYWYQREPHAQFPKLAAPPERIPVFPPEFRRAHAKVEAFTVAFFNPTTEDAEKNRERVPQEETTRIVQLFDRADEALERGDYHAADGYLSGAVDIARNHIELDIDE
jgi:hypothetical protein